MNFSKKWVEDIISDFLISSQENYLDGCNRIWDDFLMGVSNGADKLYDLFKQEYIGPFHWTPIEIFSVTYPDILVSPEELSVISWVLPQHSKTKQANKEQTYYPARFWAVARMKGEEINNLLRAHIVQKLEEEGIQAVAPVLSPKWSRQVSEKYGYASSWSERHAAYVAGLGTFGICDGLITSKGKSHRVGSVVGKIDMEASPRPYTRHQEYCLFFTKGTCKKCIYRCPVGAISEKGKDKEKCRNHVKYISAEYIKEHYGFEGYGCGLCQTGVPCESRIPVAQD